MMALGVFGRQLALGSRRALVRSLVVCSVLAFGSSASASTITFSNTTAIAINDYPTAPSSSSITVSGMSGTLLSLSLSLFGFGHTYASDVDVLLVSPTGASLIVLSDVGSVQSAPNVDLVLSDAAATYLPATSALESGTFRPTNNTDSLGSDDFGSPAPAGPYASAGPTGTSTLASEFGGANPNGVWSLYVRDDAGADSGSIRGGWALTLTTNDVTQPPPQPQPVPEPATLVLLGTGLAGVVARRRRRA